MTPTLPMIIIASRSVASRHLMSRSRSRAIACLVSIGEPGEQPPSGYQRIARRLRLEFADADVETAEAPCATADDIRRLVGFAATVATAPGKTLIHCQAGISRSTAAAYIVLAVILGPGREAEALEAMLAAAPLASPNRWMVQLADDALGRGGRLLAALSATPVADPRGGQTTSSDR